MARGATRSRLGEDVQSDSEDRDRRDRQCRAPPVTTSLVSIRRRQTQAGLEAEIQGLQDSIVDQVEGGTKVLPQIKYV
jgi:hypothetical protein